MPAATVWVTQPRAQLQRLALARRFVDDFDPAGDVFDDVLVDDVDAGDQFERAFAPWWGGHVHTQCRVRVDPMTPWLESTSPRSDP